MSTGRPSDYTDELAADLCDSIASGKTLVDWCKAHDVNVVTVSRWMSSRPDFSMAYARAKVERIDVWAEEIQELADKALIGKKVKTKRGKAKEGDSTSEDVAEVEEMVGDNVERSKLQIESRKWLLARLAAKQYGDRVAHELSGPDGKSLVLRCVVERAADPEEKES